MFTLYDNTEKELFMNDYKPIPNLESLNCTQLVELLENLYSAAENAFIFHNELLSIALYDDIVTVQKYRIEQYIRIVSSGHIAIIIDNTKYIEIDKALSAAMKRLSAEYTEDDIFFDMVNDIEKIDSFIKKAYKAEKGEI